MKNDFITPSLFAANYEMRHIASDDVIFTDPKTGAEAHFIEQGTAHIDAAYGGTDYTAFTAMNKVGNTLYVSRTALLRNSITAVALWERLSRPRFYRAKSRG